MRVYHGSYTEIPVPDVSHSRRAVDFGPGFYVTPIYEQAKKWAEKFGRRGKSSVISEYEFNENAFSFLKALRFDSYSDEWLNYVIACRKEAVNDDYDIIIGGVANDKVFDTVELFFDGLIEASVAIERLKYEKPNLQICFKTQKAIDNYLKFSGSEML
ncbi:MAG: DUF3990 domain-containing protein [Clostridiales bacterium]|nr:DUF3990 domain-containing protein [Clostridiales bacterium]